MSNYKVEFSPAALRGLKRLSAQERTRILKNIKELAYNPRPHGYRQLSEFEKLFRIRVGDYRIVYSIKEGILTVSIVKIGHRSKVYKKLG